MGVILFGFDFDVPHFGTEYPLQSLFRNLVVVNADVHLSEIARSFDLGFDWLESAERKRRKK